MKKKKLQIYNVMRDLNKKTTFSLQLEILLYLSKLYVFSKNHKFEHQILRLKLQKIIIKFYHRISINKQVYNDIVILLNYTSNNDKHNKPGKKKKINTLKFQKKNLFNLLFYYWYTYIKKKHKSIMAQIYFC